MWSDRQRAQRGIPDYPERQVLGGWTTESDGLLRHTNPPITEADSSSWVYLGDVRRLLGEIKYVRSVSTRMLNGNRLSAGTRLGDQDRYEVREAVGRGGMAEVYRAVDRRLNNRVVAVKMLSASVAEHPHARRLLSLFIEEAQALSRVKDDNVVDVLDSGTASDGTPFMVMEFLKGRDLAGLLKEQKRLSVTRTADIMVAVCAGVHACHVAGIIHRDLKPANIFLAETGRGEQPKVLDFGVAKIPVSRDQTRTDLVVGTPRYMSPEQALGRPADERSDQYSIGALVYRCLAGRPPEGLLPKPRDARPDVPVGLEAVLLRAMDPIPDNRYPSVHEFGHALLAFASPAGRLKWRAYYARRPVAAPITANTSSDEGDDADVAQPSVTPIAPYDFAIHEQTTNTAVPPLEERNASSANASPAEGPSTVSENPLEPFPDLAIAPSYQGIEDLAETHARLEAKEASAAGPDLGTTKEPRHKRAFTLSLVGGAGLLAVVGAVYFAGHRSSSRPQISSSSVWTGQVTAAKAAPSTAPTPIPTSETTPPSSAILPVSTPPAPLLIGREDPEKVAAALPAITAEPIKVSHQKAGTTRRRSRSPLEHLGKRAVTPDATVNSVGAPKDLGESAKYPAVGRSSESKYPAVD